METMAALELSVSLFVPPHNPATQLLELAAAELQNQSQGRLRLRIYSSEQLGSTPDQFDLARSGRADLAYLMHGATPGLFPLTELATLPFVVRDPVSGTAALMAVKTPYLDHEHPDVKLLFVAANAPMAIHSVKPVCCLDDFKGMRIRHAGQAVAATLAALGAEPINVMPLRVKEALTSGQIDAAAMTYEGAYVTKLTDAAPYVFELNANTVTFALVMNRARYEALDAKSRKLLEEVLGASAGHRLALRLSQSGLQGQRHVQNSGAIVTQPSGSEHAILARLVEPVVESALRDLSSKGKPGRQVYDALVARGPETLPE